MFMQYLSFTFSFVCGNDMQEIVSDVLASELVAAGFEAFEPSGSTLHGFVQEKYFNEEQLKQVLDTFPIENVKITYQCEQADNQNWNATWESEGFEPIEIGKDMLIYDAKHPSDLVPHTIEIGIDACQAFGTGTHQTTQMMLTQLSKFPTPPASVLDAGCGSGILSIAAAKLGAEQVVAYDIDEWSVSNTSHNATLNGVADSIRVLLGDSEILKEVDEKFDLVMANINRNILIADMSLFVMLLKPQGKILLSGFYEADIPLLIERAQALGLNEECRMSNQDWCCLLLAQATGKNE